MLHIDMPVNTAITSGVSFNTREKIDSNFTLLQNGLSIELLVRSRQFGSGSGVVGAEQAPEPLPERSETHITSRYNTFVLPK